jgi:phage tail sheath gpL-like
MAITKAVASSIKTPGVFLTVDLLGGAASPGAQALNAIIVSPQAGGDLVNDTEVRRISSGDDARDAFGFGSPGHLTALRLFAKHPLAVVDAISPTPSAGAIATGTLTLVGTPTENSTLEADVCGRKIESPWNTGESVTTGAATLALAIGLVAASAASPLPATTAAALGVVTLTARSAGPWGNDITIGIRVKTGGAGITSVTASGARLTGGTVEPNFTTALSNLSTLQYRLIPAQLSNADATDATTSSNAHRLKTHINTYETGLDALLQIGVVGVTPDSLSTPTAATTARNDEAMEYIFGYDFQSLPCEIAGDEVGDQLKFHSIRANYNRIGNKTLGLFGSKDVLADKLTPAELETLLNAGVTPLNYERGSNDILLVRPITTHFLSGFSADYRAFDLSDIHGTYTVADDLRTAIPQEFANASLSPDLPAGAAPLPPGVVEIRDIKNFVIARLGLWTGLGVVNAVALQTSVEDGTLIVEIDSGDPTQVNIFLPLTILAPLAKVGIVASKQQATA